MKKHTRRWLNQAWVGMLLSVISAGARAADVDSLRCEHVADPLGIDVTHPRLSWVLHSDRRGDGQTAYEILVATSADALKADRGDLWDSGKVTGDVSTGVEYAGPALKSAEACFWKVKVWDKDGHESAYSQPARWEMGLLRPEDWNAKWVEAPMAPTAASVAETLEGAKWIWFPEPGADLSESAPAGERFFRKVITLPEGKEVPRASMIISVDDQYTLLVNGKTAGKVVAPDGWKKPKHYDLGKFLHPGENVIAVRAVNLSGAAGVCAKLALDAGDASPATAVTDGSWKTAPAAAHGWDSPGFDDAAWKDAAEIAPYGRGVWGNFDDGRWTSAVPMLRKAVTVANKPIASARLYATALGLYEFHLNGHRVGDHVLAPDWTDYRKRVRYQAYDVTAMLKPGENALAALVANGWYSGHIGNGGFRVWGTTPAVMAELVIIYADGSTATAATDETWKFVPSAITASDFMLGESYDAQREVKGWDAAGFDDAAWGAVKVRPSPAITVDAQVSPPVRELREVKPIAITEPAPGRYTFDLGQNMVGVVRLRVSAPAGTKVTLHHAEMLNPDGTVYLTNLRGAPSVDTYICRGDSDGEIWQPRFTFHGFRYVELTGLPAKPSENAVTGIVLGSDTPWTGHFSCSDDRINQLVSNIQWGQRGNYLSVPTDCPQRDERMGWMGDAEVFIRTATTNADVDPFFTKWLVDVDDAQSADGVFTDVSPSPNPQRTGTPAWGDAGVICPWTIYLAYDDRRILEQHFPAMVKWVEWCRAHSNHLIREKDRGGDYGDWLAIGANTPKDLIGTAYFAYSTHLLAKAAGVLGKKDEEAKYNQLFEDIKAAFNQKYVAEDGRITGNTQCCYAMALKFELLPEALRPKAAAYLDEDIRARGYHLSTGFVGVSYLLPMLADAGKVDTAYKLLLQDSFPSWLFSVKHGATTIWERWDGWTPEKGFQNPGMNSFNHYSLGSCGQWLMDSVAGLGWDADRPGYRHMVVRPLTDGPLTWAKGSEVSYFGPMACDWKRDGEQLKLNLAVPANATATVYVPAADPEAVQEGSGPAARADGVKFVRAEGGAAVYEVGSGTYAFSSTAKPR